MKFMEFLRKLWQPVPDSDDRTRRVDNCVDSLRESTGKARRAFDRDARVGEEEVQANDEVRHVITELISRIDAP